MKRLILFILISIHAPFSYSQINSSPSQYFYNKLYQNVAATGFDKGFRLDASYRNFITPNTFVGSPVNVFFAAQSSVSKRSGVGVQFQSETAGLINQSKLLGSYALDFGNENTHIRLGVGFGVMSTRIKTGTPMFQGDMNDPFVAQFNNRRMQFDGSVGIQIETANGWSILTSVPSLGTIQQFSQYQAIDYVLLNTNISKRIKIVSDDDGDISISPLIGYQLMQGVDGVFKTGLLLDYKNWIRFMGMMYSNREFSAGVSLPLKSNLALNFTCNTGRIYGKELLNAGGTMEAHIMYRFNN